MGGGTSLQRLQKEAGRSLRTLRRWARRWRQWALRTVPWLAAWVYHMMPEREPPRYSADEAPSGPRRAVAEELRWLDALGEWQAQEAIEDEIRGWSWANLRFQGQQEWF